MGTVEDDVLAELQHRGRLRVDVGPGDGFWGGTRAVSAAGRRVGPGPAAPTVHGERDAAFSREAVVCDGDLHLVRPVVQEPQVVEEQRPVLKDQDAVAVLGPQGPDDVGADGLDDSDGLFPPELPPDDRLVQAEAAVADRQQGLPSHRPSDQIFGNSHIYGQHATCRHTPRFQGRF